MLSLPKPRRRSGGDDHLIPLINIVFLLLIFFMVAGRVEMQQGAELSPPQARSETPLQQDATLILALQADGALSVNGDVITADAAAPAVSGDALTAINGELPLINQQQLAEKISALNLAKDSAVIVRVHASLPAKSLDPLLAVLREQGFSRINLATVARL